MPNSNGNNPSGNNQYSQRDRGGDSRRDASSDRDRGASSGNAGPSAPRAPGDERNPSWLNTAGDRKR